MSRVSVPIHHLAALRDLAGLTQQQAAVLAQIAPSTWSALECGRHNARPQTRRQIARALHLPESVLALPEADAALDAAWVAWYAPGGAPPQALTSGRWTMAKAVAAYVKSQQHQPQHRLRHIAGGRHA